MKIRIDFVTNSSSSSFMVIYELNQDLTSEKVKEELGNFGLRIFNNDLESAEEALKYFDEWYCASDDKSDDDQTIEEYIKDNYGFELRPDGKYIVGHRITYTNEGDTDSDCLKLVDVLGKDFFTLIFEGEEW